MSDPELLPIHRSRCPNCTARMTTTELSAGPKGFERRTFECPRCQHREIKVLASDPLRSNAVGWTTGELQPPR
jgi:Zn finger protein HypA/HybF involved in hydrogenase expression